MPRGREGSGSARYRTTLRPRSGRRTFSLVYRAQRFRAGHAFNRSETAPASTENGRDRERPEHHRGGGVARNSPAVPCRGILRSLNTTNNRGRETMRDDPWTAANRDKEQQKVTIRPRRKQTSEIPAVPAKPTISGPFWTGKQSAPDLPRPRGVVDARQRTDD